MGIRKICLMFLFLVGIAGLACVVDFPYDVDIALAYDSMTIFLGETELTATEGEAYFTESTSTLTLNNASIDTGRVVDGYFAAVSIMDSVTLELKGENIISLNADNIDSVGLYVAGQLCITGTGSLDIQVVDEKSNPQINVYGICADKVTLEGANVNILVDDACNDDVCAVYTTGGGVVLTQTDLTISVPYGMYLMYDSTSGNSVQLTKGKGFSYAIGGTTENAAFDLTYEGVALSDLQIAKYYYFSATVRTIYTAKHFVMGIDGCYSSSPLIETCYAKESETLTLADLKKSSLEMENGIEYSHAESLSNPAVEVNVSKDGTTVVSLYYARKAYELTKIEGIGTSFTIDNEGHIYYGETVTMTNRNVDPDRYEDFVMTVKYTSNGVDVASYNSDTDTFVMPAAAVTVKSTATAKTYSIIYNLSDGMFLDDSVSSRYTCGVEEILPVGELVEKSGYVFSGWYSDAKFQGNPMDKIAVDDYGDKTFYAKWKCLSLTYNVDGEALATVYVVGGIDDEITFSLKSVSTDDYDFEQGNDFKSVLTGSESITQVFCPSLMSGTVNKSDNKTTYTLKIAVETDKSQLKLLVVEDNAIISKTAAVIDGYIELSVSGLNDIALIEASEQSTAGPDVKTSGERTSDLLWLYILLPCLVLAIAAITVVYIRKKK